MTAECVPWDQLDQLRSGSLTHDVGSELPPNVQAAYKECVERANNGTLVFPNSHGDPPGKTSEPFVRFVHDFYKAFGTKEKRINIEIKKKGFPDPATAAQYLHSLTVPIPPDMLARHGQTAHAKAVAALARMHAAAAADGVPLKVLSGFRMPHGGMKSKNSYAKAGSWSSHSFGLALDFELSVGKQDTADHKGLAVTETKTTDAKNLMQYYESPVMKWLAMNAPKFDFHPYMMEPWHYEFNPQGMADEIVQGLKAYKK